MVEGKTISIGNVAYVLGMDPKRLDRWYKDYLSGFADAERRGEIGCHDVEVVRSGEKKKIKVPICKPENLGPFMAVDEKTIDGTCYTILSNRETSKIALMASTLRAEELHKCLKSFPFEERLKVKSVTRDMAQYYDWFARTSFLNAYQVADKFHVMKDVLEQLQSVRIRHRQEILALERKKKKTDEEAKLLGKKFSNGDTLKQLLHRSRGLLFKTKGEWSEEQRERAKILFNRFPEIREAYRYCQSIRNWYRPITPKYTDKKYAKKQDDLDALIREGANSQIDEIQNIARFLDCNKSPILRYFYRRESNAKAEALNQNLQRFINVNYGARNTDFFLFRVALHFS